jgi:pilus assembly protein CpaB
MNPVRLAILLVAAVAAVGLALLLRNMATKPKSSTPVVASAPAAAKPVTRVLTAARDLEIGVRLAPADMAWQDWPVESLNPAYITDGVAPAPKADGAAAAANTASTVAKDLVTGGGQALQALAGSVVKEPILKGEPILARKIVKGGEGGYMAVVLAPGMRAMSVPVNAETGAGGFVQPGDRVDLIESHQDSQKKGGQGFDTSTVVSNVRVLAVDQNTDPAKNGKSIVGATVTLEIPAPVVEVVAEAKARGGVMLALRSYADMAGGAGRGGAAMSGGPVRVFKGGQLNEVTVSR